MLWDQLLFLLAVEQDDQTGVLILKMMNQNCCEVGRLTETHRVEGALLKV